MDINQFIMQLLATNSTLATFLAGLYNEEALLFMVFLAGTGSVALYKAILLGFVGNMIHDSLLFALGRTRVLNWTKNKLKLSTRMTSFIEVIESMRAKTDLLPLFISKFVYGARTALILYVSNTKTPYFKFLAQNTLASAMWALILVPVAYWGGKGFASLLTFATGVQKMLGALLLVIVVVYVIHKVVLWLVFKYKKH